MLVQIISWQNQSVQLSGNFELFIWFSSKTLLLGIQAHHWGWIQEPGEKQGCLHSTAPVWGERWYTGESDTDAGFPGLTVLLVLSKATKRFAKYKGFPVIMGGCLLVFKTPLIPWNVQSAGFEKERKPYNLTFDLNEIKLFFVWPPASRTWVPGFLWNNIIFTCL